VRTPAACGENVIGIVQLPAAAIVPTQFVFPIAKSLAFNPFTATLATCNGAFPVLLSVAFWGPPLVPCVIVPLGGKVPGEVTLATGAGVGPSIPVPASVTTCGLPGELSEIINVAWLTPGTLGAYVTEITQEWFGTSTGGARHVSLSRKSLAFGPLIMIDVKVTGWSPLLDNVTGKAPLVCPAAVDPKLSDSVFCAIAGPTMPWPPDGPSGANR